LWLANALALLLLINLAAGIFFFRVDLTEEKRYSIKPQTKEVLAGLQDEVFIEVFLAGELNAGFTRLQKALRETLTEFAVYSNYRVKYVFTDPAQAASQKAQSDYMQMLAGKGIQPTNVIDNKGGTRLEKLVFPGALVSYQGRESGVMLLKGNRSQNPQEVLNQSIEGLEFELINAIYTLASDRLPRIGWATGHGELQGREVEYFMNSIHRQYAVRQVGLNQPLTDVDVLVIAKPTSAYSVLQRYYLDQFIMSGGRVLWLLDKIDAAMDSAARPNYYAFPYTLDLDDQLFKYGVRINNDLLQDRVSAKYPIVTGQLNGRPQIMQTDWPFFPLINHYAEHPVTLNLDATWLRFASSMDTVRVEGVKKTPLLMTSAYTRTVAAPVRVSAADLRQLDAAAFQEGAKPIAYLLEGNFTSAFKNRFLPDGNDQRLFREKSVYTRQIVVADGDLARNDVNPRTGEAQPLGRDPFTQYTFANHDLLMNMLAYLANEQGIIAVRNKQVRLRPLDKAKVAAEKIYWQALNLSLPLVVLALFAVGWRIAREKKFRPQR